MAKLLVLLADILGELRRIRAFTASSMSVQEAAACIGVSDKTLTKWIAEGLITPVPHTGRRVLVARIELDRFAAGAAVPTRSAVDEAHSAVDPSTPDSSRVVTILDDHRSRAL